VGVGCGGGGWVLLIQLFNAKISTNYVVFTSNKEMKVIYIYKVLKCFGGYNLDACLYEVLGLNLDECVHQCISYKYNI